MIKANYIVFDCETGGLDETKNPITQYAAIILDGKNLKEIDRWETFVKPYNGLTIEQAALDKTMVSMSDINSGISVKEFVKTATEFWSLHRVKTKYKEAGYPVPVGHNIPFDIRMLNYALELQKVGTVTDYMQQCFIDTLPLSKLAFGILGNEKINLGVSCERAKIKLTDAHGAMNDVEATAELLRYFMKKMRTAKGSSSDSKKESSEREKGSNFFEFKCSVK